VSALIAPSFAGLFYRNCFNLGLPAVVCADAGKIRQGDELKIDFSGRIENLTQGKTYSCEAIPAHLQALVRDGGLLPHLEKRLKRA
jgi:3-isopropylmalate/(R)-2-methylmalate dehydratase small subunit